MNNYNRIVAATGVRIKGIRLSKNLTQLQLAALCDFNKAGISRIEAGKANVTIRTLVRISEALDVSINSFF